MQDLSEGKRKLDAEIAELGRQGRLARRRATAKARAAERVWSVTGTLLHTVLIGYFLADGVPDPGVVFLRQRGRQRH